MKRKQPETSLEAFRSLKSEEIALTYWRILQALHKIGEGTFEDIALSANMQPAQVWKRLSELLKEDKIKRTGEKKVLKSGRKGYVWTRVVEIKKPSSFKQQELFS